MVQNVPPQRILVVEDETTVRQSIHMLLNAEGHQVEAVSNAEQALEKLENRKYDFVFTDHIMGRISGAELARSIKEKDPSQMVVVLTAYYEIVDQLSQVRPFVDLTLTKPLEIPFLRLALNHLISKRSKENSVGLRAG